MERVKAGRGPKLRCQGWRQEAILRMLENNLENAEKPDELIIYGGTGKAARNWEAFHRIVDALRSLRDDETLIVQSGKPVAIFKSHRDASIGLVGNCGEILPELIKRGVKPDVVTDQTSAHDPLGGYIPIGLSVKEAEGLRVSDPEAYLKRSRKSIAIHVKAMIALGSKGSIVFEYGNGIRAQ